MNHHIASQQSIQKQVLVNKLKLFPELANVVKDFTFYDRVSQVSYNLKNRIIDELDRSFSEETGFYTYTEGYGTMGWDGDFVRYRHTGIQYTDSPGGLQFITCYRCGNYILSESSNAPEILCNCGVINLVDDEVDLDEIDEMNQNFMEMEAMNDDDDGAELEDDASASEEEIMEAYNHYVAQSSAFALNLNPVFVAETNDLNEDAGAGAGEEEPPIYFRAEDALEYGQEEDDEDEEDEEERERRAHEDYDDEEYRVSNYFNQMDYYPEDEY